MSRRGNQITLTVHIPDGVAKESICQDAMVAMFVSQVRGEVSAMSNDERDNFLLELSNAIL